MLLQAKKGVFCSWQRTTQRDLRLPNSGLGVSRALKGRDPVETFMESSSQLH